jgi:hypothetical protein
MIRDAKYKPVSIKIYCPACGQTITRDEWMDYGMHLQCTPFFQRQQSEKTKFKIRNKQLEKCS